ncbi:hypothetical protein ACLVWU_03130 [Bdellovibrio sp. HCB290]|uniref:hypothetical protein n=1 Tax=Bdellovibrio sp. HCB290 TaxID=3394356 RepID=UPI0039B3CE58
MYVFLNVDELIYTHIMPPRNRPSELEKWIMITAFLISCYCGFMFFWSVIDAVDSTALMYALGVLVSSYIGVKIAGPSKRRVD